MLPFQCYNISVVIDIINLQETYIVDFLVSKKIEIVIGSYRYIWSFDKKHRGVCTVLCNPKVSWFSNRL